MNSKKTFKLVLAAVFCAMVFTMTWIAIPAPSVGNINLGDCMIILCALLLGNSYAVLSAGIGAALCDLASGYTIYAPGTFIIKALMVIVILLMRKYILKGDKHIVLVILGVCAELVMVAGYLIYEAFVIGYGVAAIMNIPFNLIQGVANLIVAILLYVMLKKAGFVKMIKESTDKK